MKTFVQFNKNKSKYKIGDVVYYHGMHRNAHGYYVIKNYYCSNDQNMWKYDLESLNKNTVQLSYIWEISLSKTKEELNLTMVKMLFKILYKTNKISKKEFESLMKNANRTSKLENI
jgi:hypothetical protein